MMLLVCYTVGQRIGLTAVATVILALGVTLLKLSRAGKIKEFRFGGGLLTGDEAKLCSAICAVIFIVLGTALGLVAMLRTGC